MEILLLDYKSKFSRNGLQIRSSGSKKITLFLLINNYILCFGLLAQNNKYFNKHWGQSSPVADFANSVVQLKDSSYFITSESNAQIANSVVKYIYKLDKTGSQFSVKSDSDLTFIRSITGKLCFNPSKNKFYLGTGLGWYDSLGNGKSVPYIFNFDSLGHFITPFIVGDTTNISSGVIYSICYSSNKNLMCSGVISKHVNNVFRMIPSYWKVDTLGNTIWEKRDSSSSCCVNQFSIIKEDSIGNFIMMGKYKYQGYATANERIWLRKIDTNGNTLWDYKYKEPDPDTTDFEVSVLHPRSFSIGNDGNYMVGADFDYFGNFPGGKPSALIKFSAVNGHVVWRYNLKALDAVFTKRNYIEKIIPIPNEGYVLVGSAYLSDNDLQGFILKVNENGQELWRKTFGVPNEAGNIYHADYFWDGIQTLDGGFAAVGQTDCAGCGTDAWLVKTNCNGDTAAPVAQFNSVINAQNNTVVTIHNQSLRYDTCVFDFGDNSPLVYKSYLDTAAFTHTYPTYATNYNIICTAKACNQEWDSTQVPIFTGSPVIAAEAAISKLRLVPNPATSVVNIVGSTTFTGFEIYNAQGLLVEKISTKPIINFQLSIANYPKGIYILKVTDKRSTLCLKLVVE